MGKKRQSRTEPDPSDKLTIRIAQLFRIIWDANKSRMARDLGFSNMTITRVIAGKQPPPGRLLEALAQRREVNVAWLMLGQGAPLLPQPEMSQGGYYCPVSQNFLLRPPADSPEKLTGATFPVPAPYFSESAYWIRVTAGSLLEKAAVEQVRSGDYVLVEAGPEWTRRIERLTEQVVAIRQSDEKRPVILVRVPRQPIDFSECLDLYELEMLTQKGKAVLDAEPVEPVKARPRSSRRVGKKPAREEWGHRFNIEEVIGVCKLSIRLW